MRLKLLIIGAVIVTGLLIVRGIFAGGGMGITSDNHLVGQTATLDAYFNGSMCDDDPSQHHIIYARLNGYYLDQPGAIDISQANITADINGVPIEGHFYSASPNAISFVVINDTTIYHVGDSAHIQVTGIHIVNPGRVGFSWDFVQDNWDTSCGIHPDYRTNPPTFLDGQIITFSTVPTPTPSLSPYPTITPYPTAIPTSTPTPTMTTDIGFVNPGPVNITVQQGTYNWHSFPLTSTYANSYAFYGYPTSYGPGINWATASGGIQPGSTIWIALQVNSNVPIGTYSGIGRLHNPNIVYGEIQFPVTITVTNVLPTPTSTPTPTPRCRGSRCH